MFRSILPVFLLGLVNLAVAARFKLGSARQVQDGNPADDPNRTPSPRITRPTHAETWNPLDLKTVTWDNTGLNVTGLNGTLLLGYLETNTTRFVWQDQPLAQGFALSDGIVNVLVPDVPNWSSYFLTLLGDMNNISPLFAIIRDDSVSVVTPPLRLPAQTMTTQSATLSASDITSSPGATSASVTGTESTSTASTAAPSATNKPNGAIGRTYGAVLESLTIAVMLAVWVM
ncbi:hypothetical protein TRAPUB_953 [Trametes pubescens]|uniref:Uncharacterized protein n=1 Tax=Trametes pubescens TaxID=154538 RepID=A0A1M2VKR1_TRAPU|nr:hypothetical protein TRAPUB_953 [Trametes pubescens]